MYSIPISERRYVKCGDSAVNIEEKLSLMNKLLVIRFIYMIEHKEAGR